MMQRKEKAVDLFRQKFNCSQAVFTAYRNPEALDEKNALKLSTILGAGVACTGGGMCGAVSGGLLALSMHYGRENIQDIEAKVKTYELGRKFMAGFESRMGSCTCSSVLGLDISIPGDMEKAVENKLFETICLRAVQTASDLLEEVL